MKKIVMIASLLTTLVFANGNSKTKAEYVEPAISLDLNKNKSIFNKDKLYVGFGFGITNIKTKEYGTDTIGDLILTSGYNFNKYFGMQIRFATGVGDGDDLIHNYSYGLYLKPMYPIDNSVTLYGLLGYSQTKLTNEKQKTQYGISNNKTIQDDFSYGVGVDYKLNKKWSVSTELVRYIDKSYNNQAGKYKIQTDAFNLMTNYKF